MLQTYFRKILVMNDKYPNCNDNVKHDTIITW